MATQAQTAQLTKTSNSTQLESSISLSDQVRTQILGITYEAAACKDVAEFRSELERAEAGAHQAAQKMFGDLTELIRYCAQVRSYRSERGVNAHLRKEAGIPAGFENWYTDFRAKYDIAWAYKTMLHKIAELEGGCEKCGRLARNDADHKTSCVFYRPLIDQAEPGESNKPKLDTKEVVNAHYADRYKSMVALLTNAPKDATPEQIFETMQNEAITAYEDLDAEMAKKIKVPKLVTAKPDPAPAKKIAELEEEIAQIKKESEAAKQQMIEDFRKRLATISEIPDNLRDDKITGSLAAEPDRDEAAGMLRSYLVSEVERVLPSHTMLDSLSVSLRFTGRDHRIMPGDWMEKRDKGDTDVTATLSKCIGVGEYKQRRKVQEWREGKWGKERVVLSEHEDDYRVISEEAARRLAPEAFPTPTSPVGL